MSIHKFCATAAAEKPVTSDTILLEKAMEGRVLTREEKDRVAEILYGSFGAMSSTYKLAGWAWPMSSSLKRILVSFTYANTFHPYYAPDKTSLRKVLSSVDEMIEA